MRSITAFFAVFAFLSLLPACNTLERKVERKAEAAVEQRAENAGMPMPASTTFMAMTMTKGPCAGWPSSVPIEPGARNVFCQTMDEKKIESSPQFKLMMAAHPEDRPQPGEKAESLPQTFLLTFEVDATEDQVDAFYRKSLKGSLPPPTLPMPVPMTPLLSRKPTPTDPLMFVMRVRTPDSTPSTTKVGLIVTVDQPL